MPFASFREVDTPPSLRQPLAAGSTIRPRPFTIIHEFDAIDLTPIDDETGQGIALEPVPVRFQAQPADGCGRLPCAQSGYKIDPPSALVPGVIHMPSYYDFEVSLKHIAPRIWRRFLLHESATFEDLHDAIQDSFGWERDHLWEFHTAGRNRQVLCNGPAEAFYDDVDAQDDPSLALAAVFFAGKGGRRKCLYTYDFGDHWQHEVSWKRKVTREDAFARELLGGERAGPLEDCGGVWGYERCVETVSGDQETDDPELAERLERLSGWDPERFDLENEQRSFDNRPLKTTPAIPRLVPSGDFDIHASPLDGDGVPLMEPAHRYVDGLMSTFVSSPEAQPLATTETFPDWAPMLVEFGFNYLGVTPATMQAADVEEIVFELFPAKITCNGDEAPYVVSELIAFFTFLGREYGLPQADTCLDVLSGPAIEDLRSAFNEPSRFGLAKQFATAGQQAGFDMANPEQADTFALLHNLAAQADRRPAPNATKPPSKKAKRKRRSKRKLQKKSRKRNR